jgi:MFS family permease
MEKEEIKKTQETEEELIEKSKKISVKEGCGWGVMEGFGSKYITPFAVAIKANNTQIGLLSSLPSLLGSFSELYTLKAMDKYSRKKIVFIGVLLQAIMWLILIGVGILYFVLNLNESIPQYSLIFIYTLLILFGAFASPAWTSWMKDLITKNKGDYFGKRSRIIGIISLSSFLIAGFILDYFKQTKIFVGFIILFSIAFIGRSISAYLMMKQYEPKLQPDKGAYFSLKEFIKKMPTNNFGRFVIYLSLVSLAVNIAGPFFAVYMLEELKFTYFHYVIVSLAGPVITFLSMPLWGKFSDKHGNVKIMKITGFFICLVPALWLLTIPLASLGLTKIIIYLVLVELFSGFVWAGFNLSTGNFIYDAVSRQRVAICVTYLNILTSIGVLIGASLGGFISSKEFMILGLSSILFIFLLSTVIRLIVYFVMNRELKEVRGEIQEFSVKKYAKYKIVHLTKIIEQITKIKGR